MNISAERAYPTPIANSPLLPLLLISLATQRNTPIQSSSFKEEYDYIVVGSGSAGSVVASRLSEEPCVTVLLLEAGAKKTPLLNDVPGLGRFFWGTDIDWQYKTVPQKNTGFALVNNQVLFPSGKGFGGSSLLNAMLYVRGNHKDYDDWAAQGAEGWSYKDVFPYFLKLEDNRDLNYLENGYHTSGGPITAEKPGYNPEIKNRIREAAQQLGYKVVDSNAARMTVMVHDGEAFLTCISYEKASSKVNVLQLRFYDLQGNLRNGQRCNAAKAYLVPVENRTNLDIIGGAHVRKVIFEDSRAVGVLLDYKNSEYLVKARREVIISAGTSNTAQLLMLSGIGPRKHLEKFNIPVIADLPVGNNLQDHPAGFLPFVLDEKPMNEKLTDPRNIKEYINNRTGPLSSLNFISWISFLGGPAKEDFPDYQLYFVEMSTKIAKEQSGMRPRFYKAFFAPYENGPVMMCLSQLSYPKSRGTVRLQSTNPYDPPLIDPNYLDDPADIESIVRGMETCRKIGLSNPMKKSGVKPFATIFPRFTDFIPDLYWYLKLIAKLAVVTVSHPVGTAKMGDPRDPTTVVDTQLRVKGVQGLRVVDASIMPLITSANTNIPTIMIAEKASDIIKKSISCVPE